VIKSNRYVAAVWYIKGFGRKRKTRIGLRIEDDVVFIQIRVFASSEQTSQTTLSLTVTEFESLKLLSHNSSNVSVAFDHDILNGRRKILASFNSFNSTATLTLFKHTGAQPSQQAGWEPRSLISVTKEELKKITDHYRLILAHINTLALDNEFPTPSNKEADGLRLIPKSNSSEVGDEEEEEVGADDGDTD